VHRNHGFRATLLAAVDVRPELQRVRDRVRGKYCYLESQSPNLMKPRTENRRGLYFSAPPHFISRKVLLCTARGDVEQTRPNLPLSRTQNGVDTLESANNANLPRTAAAFIESFRPLPRTTGTFYGLNLVVPLVLTISSPGWQRLSETKLKTSISGTSTACCDRYYLVYT